MDSQISYNNLIAMLEQQAVTQPESLACEIIDEDGLISSSISYAELFQQTVYLAAQLSKHCQPGDRALLLYNNSVEFVCAFFACLYTGVIAVPLVPPRFNKQFQHVLSVTLDCLPSVILTVATHKQQADMIVSRVNNAIQVIISDFDIAEENEEQEWYFDTIGTTPSQIAYLQYSPGSVEVVKGVIVSHENVLSNLANIYQEFECSSSSYMVSWLPIYDEVGLVLGLLLPLYGGFPVSILQPSSVLKQPYLWLKAISDRRATMTVAPNFAFDLCVDSIPADMKSSLVLTGLHCVVSTGEPVFAQTIERFSSYFSSCGFNTKAFNPCYSLAEAASIVTMHKPEEPMTIEMISLNNLGRNKAVIASKHARALVSCGSAQMEQQLIIVSPKTLKICQAGQVGEIWLSGPTVCQGYWGNIKGTLETFQAKLSNGYLGSSLTYLRTGDLAYIRNGKLFVTGSLKDLIVINDVNYYPQDIETKVKQSWDGFYDGNTAAFIAEVRGKQRLICVQELSSNCRDQIEIEWIGSQLSDLIDREFNLKLFELVIVPPSTIPAIYNGKVQRHLVQNMWQQQQLNILAVWDPTISLINSSQFIQTDASTSTNDNVKTHQKTVNDLVKEINASSQEEIYQWLKVALSSQLKVPMNVLSDNDSFLNQGVDEAIAETLAERLTHWLNMPVEPKVLFANPTINRLSEKLHHLFQQQHAQNIPEMSPTKPLEKVINQIGQTTFQLEKTSYKIGQRINQLDRTLEHFNQINFPASVEIERGAQKQPAQNDNIKTADNHTLATVINQEENHSEGVNVNIEAMVDLNHHQIEPLPELVTWLKWVEGMSEREVEEHLTHYC